MMPDPEPNYDATEGCAAMPCSAGFFWWRATPEKAWRMVQIVDFRPEGSPYLCAYDVELKEWGGRTLKVWAEMEPAGEWIAVRKPETPEEREACRLKEHACDLNRDMMGKCFVCGSMRNAEVSHRDRERQPDADQPTKQP